MTTTAHRIPLEELQHRAVEELLANPTINTWIWVDGREIRASMSLLEAIRWALDQTLELVGEYVEVMQVSFTDSDVYFDPKAFSLDGSRPYDRADWHNTGTPAREKATEPVVLLGCRLPWQPTIDAEIVQPELESRDRQ